MLHRGPVFFAATVALMACGHPASESLQARAQPQPDQTSQADVTTPPQVAAPPAAFPIAATSESEHCLDLVNDGAFEAAVPVCVRATGLDPENTAVKQALETARSEAGAAALGGSSAIPIAREDGAAGVAVDGRLP